MFHVHRSSSGLALAAALGDVLAAPLEDVFKKDVVSVPAKGVERWLAQRLSERLGAGSSSDGVCANIDFPSPARLLDEALLQLSPELGAAVQAWDPERAVWPLINVLDASSASQVRHHLGKTETSARRYGLASRLALRFGQIADNRPELLVAWASGRDDVDPDLAWQPAVWRELRDRIGTSPAELHAAVLDQLKAHPELVDLPQRLALFGATRISKARLQVLAALAVHRDVHLFLPHPGQALWDEVAGSVPVVLRADDQHALALAHPLLVSLSRDVRELQQRLTLAVPDLQTTMHPSNPRPAGLLQQLQEDLQSDTVPATPRPGGSGDRSIQVHACHGPARQVEVLREVVLGILRDDPTLEPRDVLVMCPNVELFAPLVNAAFDTDAHPGGRLRVSIADRSPRQTNPMLGVAGRLLELAGTRITGAQVLDLVGIPAVRRKFGFSDDDVEQVRSWTVATHVNWGIDADFRKPWKLSGLAHGTWRTGLDRLLTGVAMGGTDRPWCGTLPLDGVDSTDIVLAGRFAELLDRLADVLGALQGRQPVAAWMTALEVGTTSLGEVPPDGAWQLAQLGSQLAEVTEAAAGSSSLLTLADVRVLLDERLAGRPTRTSFRTGGLTVCTLTPMRSVPHRVICLLGMDDTAFPRQGLADGDDVLARNPQLGERDARSEDRQLFLDALLAAEDKLVITYTGADVRTGIPLPPAVPVGELLDALDLTAEGASRRVMVRHPLQTFDSRNFRPGELGTPGPFSFDTAAYDGALAAIGARVPQPGISTAPLPAQVRDIGGFGDVGDVVELQRLAEFWEHPAKGFLRQRLQVTSSGEDEEPSDAIALELDALEQWSVGDRTLDARLAGASADDVLAAEWARGQLPPGHLGQTLMRLIGGRVDALVRASAPYRAASETSVDVDVMIGDRRLVGSLQQVRGDRLVRISYSTLAAKQRLRAWIELLALTAAQPDRSWTSAVIGRGTDDAVVETYGPVAPDDARTLLHHLVLLRDLGLRTPLLAPVKTAESYARARSAQRSVSSARALAGREWESGYNYPKEDRDPDNVLVFGSGLSKEQLWEWRCPLELPIQLPGEPSDTGGLACSVWLPLLTHEVHG